MLSLKESILSSNNAGIISEIKDIMLTPASKKGAEQLNRLWKKLKVDLDGFEWIPNSERMYTYIQKKKKNPNLTPNQRSIIWSGSIYVSNILVRVDNKSVGWTRQLSEIYMKKLIELLNLTLHTENESLYYLNFK